MSQDIGAVPAASPQPGAPALAETERIIVTGSNIPTAEEVGPNPVVNINRELINKTGERNTGASSCAICPPPARKVFRFRITRSVSLPVQRRSHCVLSIQRRPLS